MIQLQVAPEIEQGMHSLDGMVLNGAARIVSHPLNKRQDGSRIYHEEGTLHQTEWQPQGPHASIDSLRDEFLDAEDRLEKICGDDALVVAVSESGAGKSKINPRYEVRTGVYEEVFGPEMLAELLTFSGLHIHMDVYRPRIVDQFNALTALQPTLAFTSTSPLSVRGKNGINCYRHWRLFDSEQGLFAKIPEDNGYVKSLTDLELRDKTRFRRWLDECNPEHMLGINPATRKPYFTPEDTGYPAVRYRPKMGKGTFEPRFWDAAPADVVFGITALVKSYFERIINEKIPISIGRGYGQYQFEGEGIVFPDEQTLADLTSQAERTALGDPEVRDYNQAIVDFSRQGSRDQVKYLAPLEAMLRTGKNPAAKMMKHLNKGSRIYRESFSPEEAAGMILYVAGMNKKGVENLEEMKN